MFGEKGTERREWMASLFLKTLRGEWGLGGSFAIPAFFFSLSVTRVWRSCAASRRKCLAITS